MKNAYFDLIGAPGVSRVPAFAVGLYILHLLIAVVVSRGLYSDGADFFVGLLSGNSMWPFWDDGKHIRLFVNLLNQFPASLAFAFGLESLPAMRLLFNFGLFFVPAILYLWCAWLSCRAKDFRVLACAFVAHVAFAMPAEIFILNQAFTTAALCWLVMHYALLDVSLRRLDYVAIIAVLALLFRSHESMLIWGGVLSFSALVGISRKGEWAIGRNNLHRYLIACGGALYVLFVAWWQFSHPVSLQTESYLQLLRLAVPAEMWQGNTRITLLLLGLLLFLSGIYMARWRYKECQGAQVFVWMERVVACGAIYGLAYGFLLLFEPWYANPFREYQYRFLITFGMGVMMLLAACLRPIPPNDLLVRYKYATLVVSFCFIGATVWQIANSVYWSAFQRVSAHSLGAADRVVVLPASVQQRLESAGLGYAYRYRWDWTWPVFGLSLHGSKNVLRIFRPEGNYEEYFKLPKGEQAYPFVPFVQFAPRGYFNFDLLRNACNQGICD